MNTDTTTSIRPASKTTAHKLRRAGLLAIAATVVAGTAFAGLGTADRAHAQPVAPPTTDSSIAMRETVTYSTVVPGWSTLVIPRIICPKTAPFLVKGDLSPGRMVPNGVEVLEPGGIGVTILYTLVADEQATARGTGLQMSSATNWGPAPNHLIIKAHCTSERDQSYAPTEAERERL